MNPNVRLANDTDWPQILTIYRYYWDKHFENMPNDYEKVLAYLKESFDNRHDYFNYWVYDNGEGEIYGWQSCLQVFNSPLRRDYNGEISTYIRHDKQNGLIAERLSQKVINEDLKTKSEIKVLWTHISTDNAVSQKLALHWGFEKISEQIPNSKFYHYYQIWIKVIDKDNI